MADHSHIEWTEATWNPIAGCSVVSPGCTNCYAMRRVAPRLGGNPKTPHYHGTTKPSKAGHVWTGKIGIASDQVLTAPLRWTRPRVIFVNSTSDLFHPDVPDEVVDRIFAVMALCPQHTFQILTKRPERMRAYLSHPAREPIIQLAGFRYYREAWIGGAEQFGHIRYDQAADTWHVAMPLPNVWLGTSVEDQKRADERIPQLLQTQAAVRFISAEPLLGPIILDGIGRTWLRNEDVIGGLPRRQVRRLDWVIVGGESGHGARPMHPDWARSLRDQCAAAGVPFFFKQWGEWSPGENVDRQSGKVRTAAWFDERWSYGSQNLAKDDDWLDAPDLYHVGKHAAGRLLDGIGHDAMPEHC